MLPAPRTARVLAGLLATLALAACSADNPTGPAQLRPAPTAASLSLAGNGLWAQDVEGTTHGGAQYRMLVPVNWNGDAVFYAHGFRDAATPIDLRESQDNFEAVRDLIGQRGFAIAYSSWSENGVAEKVGAQDIHQLRGLFAASFGQPNRSYLAGHSLGGLVVEQLAEKYPDQYAGVLPMCGVMGGLRREVQYLGDTRAVWDAFFPGVLPGSAGDLPEITDVNAQIVNPVVGAILGQPGGVQRAFAISRITQTPVPVVPGDLNTQVQTLVGSLAYALAFHARGFADLTARTHGHLPYDNGTTTSYVYTGSLDPGTLAFVNSSVGRFASTPDAQNYLDHNYEPSGDVRIPMLTLHTMWDAAVPIFHEGVLARTVSDAGRGDLLLQRSIPAYGHCNFTPAQMIGGFDSLVQWVTTGQKPAT